MGQWEKGITAPTRENVFALEDFFGVPGQLTSLLGYGRPPSSEGASPAGSSDLPDKIERLSDRDRRAIERLVDEMLSDG